MQDLALERWERELVGIWFFHEESVHGGLVGAAANVRAEGAECVTDEEEVALRGVVLAGHGREADMLERKGNVG